MMRAFRDPVLWTLALLTLLVKGPLLWFNAAEYTDGLIQLQLFQNHCPLYMPLYTLCCLAVERMGPEPIMAGRLVSLVAHAATLLPVAAIALWLTGSRSAARWAAVLYAISPVPTRWGIRVMTDSLFASLWWISLAGFLASIPAARVDEGDRARASAGGAAVCLAAGALAALTRHTGWVLAPLGFVALFGVMHSGGLRRAWAPAAALFLYAAPMLWAVQSGSIGGHGHQVEERLTSLAALSLVEAYAVDWPIFVGWPLAILAVWGAARPVASGQRWGWFVFTLLWGVAGVIALQVLIQSYLERYLLPLFGFAAILGGSALARLQAERPRLLAPVAAVTIAWLILFSASSLWSQRQAWMDFRQGAEELGRVASPDTPCFTNETYAMWPDGGTTKAEFWSGRSVEPLFFSTPDGGTDLAPLNPGSLLLLNSAYGGMPAFGQLVRELSQRYELESVGEWRSRITPLLPDLMDGPYHQNPLAMRLRRVPQAFQTNLIRVIGPRATAP